MSVTISAVWPGKPYPRGASWDGEGVNFAVFSENAEKIELCIFDDKGRMMVIICHNTDLGDGWEREGENYYYFREFSEKKAFPLGINIIFYAMTH